ncbi:Dynein light chain 1, cytoplasmic [Lemmus lemmus]
MYNWKAVIKNAVKSNEIPKDSVQCTIQALEKYDIVEDIVTHIKKEFDKKYYPLNLALYHGMELRELYGTCNQTIHLLQSTPGGHFLFKSG